MLWFCYHAVPRMSEKGYQSHVGTHKENWCCVFSQFLCCRRLPCTKTFSMNVPEHAPVSSNLVGPWGLMAKKNLHENLKIAVNLTQTAVTGWSFARLCIAVVGQFIDLPHKVGMWLGCEHVDAKACSDSESEIL